MNHLNKSHKDALSKLRGRFQDRGKEKAAALFYSYLFLVGLPGFFLWALFHEGIPEWPLNSDQWGLIIMIPFTAGLGLWFKKGINFYYLFDGQFITAFESSGKEFKKIKIEDLISIQITFSRGNKFIELKTERSHMNVAVSRDLQLALAKIEAEPDASGQRR